MRSAFLATAVLATAGVAFYFSNGIHVAKASGPVASSSKATASNSLSLPLFFEPNQGQTDPQVKFLARGAGYGLFLTADEAVLQLQRTAGKQQQSTQPASVIRMRMVGANAWAQISGASPLPGKSNYIVGNDPSKWQHNLPQFAQVEYRGVYPGVDLVYYGDQGKLEYDFRVAPSADPNRIALSFEGATTHIDSGDLLLSTAQGDVRFHAPRIYQQDGKLQQRVAGSFRQLADNRVGFKIGNYDHQRELVIDPVLTYSTYLGGSNTEDLVNLAVDANGNLYLAGSTLSTNFPTTSNSYQSTLAGSQNIFIAVLNPFQAPGQQLLYATYLGGSNFDYASGIALSSAVDQGTTPFDIYVAGWTTSQDFPTAGVLTGFQSAPQSGTHGFVARLNFSASSQLRYSTYLAGNGVDTVTGLAVDDAGNAFVTGTTTSTNDPSNGFPANANGYQLQSNAPNQFFASEINTKGSGPLSMIYSTYFGGGNPQSGQTQGGGIALDTSGDMYITGGTNFLSGTGPNGEAKFPLLNAQQACLDEPGKTACTLNNPTALDAFVAKINPKSPGTSSLLYSTYLGGSSDDVGYGIAIDTSNAAYITGKTFSADWVCTTSCPGGFQGAYGGGGDAFIAKIGSLQGTVYPLTYFSYLGGSGFDVGQSIQVDTVQGVHVVGSTSSCNLPTFNPSQPACGGSGDAFVASILTSSTGQAPGDFVSYLGGSGLDQGTAVAVDVFGTTYAAGTTVSPNFPTANPYQAGLNGGSQDAFITKFGSSSQLSVVAPTTSPSPNPVAAGTQVAFTFDIINNGPDTATNVSFIALVPTTGLGTTPTAKVTSSSGTCGAVSGNTIQCIIPSLAPCTGTCTTGAAVEVDVTPSITGNPPPTQVSVTGSASANGGPQQSSVQQIVPVVDFKISASTSTPTINAGDTATIQVQFCPTNGNYSGTITPSQTTSPSMVTATTPTFNPTSVTLAGTACASTTLSIPTVARPITTGSLVRPSSFYATWLPIGGLSLVGIGFGAGRKRRRWLLATLFCVIAGALAFQVACGSSSSTVTTSGGTQAGFYTVTISGSASAGASHSGIVNLRVN